MPKPEPPHHGMQTVVFQCAAGDSFRAHGHADHGPHKHEVRRLRELTKRGCPVMKLQPGTTQKKRCGKKVTEATTNHPVPERVEPAERPTVPAEAPTEDLPLAG